jgi:polysaccharide export outer membrane protein
MTKTRFVLPFLLVGIFTVFVLVSPRFAFAEDHEAESKESVVVGDSPSHADGANTPAAAPSLWGGFLSAIGLNNDMPAPPPQELKGGLDLFGQDYVIGPGDQLGVTVWRDDMLTRTALVLPDGKIQFPLIGELVVGGKTVGEVKKELVEKLASYVVDADISVEVKQSSSLFIYIIGRVNAPGRQMLVADTTILQALAMAGGLNPFASEDKIKIFRQQKDSTLVYKFRYSYVSAGKHLEDNILLKRGDVIVVP